jgi:soluble lytic murein transglycosylase-like protein
MQVMPNTARNPGFGITPAQADTPQEYNRVGQQYFQALHRRYGDPAKAWAAYNAGPGRVDHALQNFGGNWLQALPLETQHYVRNNMRMIGG